MLRFNPFKSMTIQGAVAALTPYIVTSFDPSVLPPKAQVAVTGLGILWSVLGLRNAVAKAAGEKVAQLGDGVLGRGAGR